jgi:MraZ protein
MFRGAAKVTVDDKGRVVVPTRHRTLLAARGEGRLVVTADRDKCLLIYPAPDWEQIEQQVMSLPSLHPRSYELQHMLVGRASEVELDGHGRIALSPELREFVALDRAAMLIGQGRRLELWDESRWNEHLAEWAKTPLTGGPDLPPQFGTLSL